jgi:hypothetical protein
MNGLLRQYYPKGMDLSAVTVALSKRDGVPPIPPIRPRAGPSR